MSTELNEKLERIRTFLEKKNADAMLLSRNENFCWLSCGHYAFVDKGSPEAVAKLLIEKDSQYVICNSSEMIRIPQEELADAGFKLVSYKWHDDSKDEVKKLLEGKRVISDDGAFSTLCLADEIKCLRYELTDAEIARYREIGPEAARVVEQCCREIQKGDSEYEIAGKVTGRMMALGYQVPVCLIAADERLEKYRHPLPTSKRVKHIAMIAVCVQKYGLTISISRIVSLEQLSDELKKKHEAVTNIDAVYINNTVEGARTGDIVRYGHNAYLSNGYEEDFHLHHQGGGIGYLTRDYCANEDCKEIVNNRQAFSWNPTIAGTKSEDTILVLDGKTEILSHSGNWVYRNVDIDGSTIQRPDILVI